MQQDRLKKLAEKIDRLAEKDERTVQRMREIAAIRRSAAAGLHQTCASFVSAVNRQLTSAEVVLDPPEYSPGSFQDPGPNLIQMNVRGRILQVAFEATPELLSTEEFRVPYTLEGTIRGFNQKLLEQDLIEEQLLFYCVQPSRTGWLVFDPRTYRVSPFDPDYLVALLDQLV